MAMDWLGALFEGIGMTFEAGSRAHVGQMQERQHKLDILQQNINDDYTLTATELAYLSNQSDITSSIVKTIIIVGVIGAVLLIIIHSL